MNEKILGISDSRPPGSFLSSSDAARILKDFGINEGNIESPYGLEGYYIFYKKGAEFIRHYKSDYVECLKIATELQDRLAFLGFAPQVTGEATHDGLYTNISEFVEPINSQVNSVALARDVAGLHIALSNVFAEWKSGQSTLEITSKAMHIMIEEYSDVLFDTHEVDDKIISDFYEVLSIIKSSDNLGHGDMHPGNILRGQDSYIFIDYESAFQSLGGSILDYYNLARFDIDLVEENQKKRKIINYLHVKSATVNCYLEDCGNYVSPHEREKFLQKICR